MELNLETKRILSLVRQETGSEFEMVADPSLQLLAKAKMATGKRTAHVIVYNPNKKAVDYSIAAQKYELASLPGNFSGLQLVSMMYVGFKQIAPEMDVGFDLSRGNNILDTVSHL